ncbi:Ankyrin repeat domain containing protein [Pandoravirus dulcis]|uniref:Ankyrin repeat domain containing protein n=1 Tax=Pandoravirus dulcis TaxID=1349409 RepID=S4VP42_9VIRU|nr:Ankyrin repeat domain containing protein [Pandoravirus dulcis]AGO82017.2 Ankyrin repeat domain containing protein [Pandoravirus dulcis]
MDGMLPDELLCLVFAHLPCLVLRSTAMRVCRQWRNVAGDAKAFGRNCLCADDAVAMRRPSRWCDVAAAAGHMRCLVYARCKMSLAWGATTCQLAARNGHLDCLVFAHSNACTLTTAALEAAGANGHLDCLAYAIANVSHTPVADLRYEIMPRACRRAANGGHIDVVRHLCEMGIEPYSTTLSAAASAGHVAVARYLIEERRMPWKPRIIDEAIASNNIDMVRYVVETLDVRPCAAHLRSTCSRHVALYLLGSGIVADKRTARSITQRGWSDAVAVICAQSPCLVNRVALWAIDSGHFRCLECALDAGAATDAKLVRAASNRDRKSMVDLLVRRGFVR